MILSVFAVHDKAVGAFKPPIFARSRGEIIRSFTDAVNDEKSDFARFSSDYCLFELGTWDDISGGFALHSDPIRMVSALEVVIQSVPSGAPPAPLPRNLPM